MTTHTKRLRAIATRAGSLSLAGRPPSRSRPARRPRELLVRRPDGLRRTGRPRRSGRGGGRARRGDVRTALLTLLAEEPRNGYQLMQEIERRSEGVWRPSPGSVYPALQQLEDEGLVRAEETDGRKLFHLTDEGRKAAEASAGRARRGTPRATPSSPTSGSCSASRARWAWRSSRSPRPAPPTSSPPPARSSPTPGGPSTESSPRTTPPEEPPRGGIDEAVLFADGGEAPFLEHAQRAEPLAGRPPACSGRASSSPRNAMRAAVATPRPQWSRPIQ